VGKQAAAWFVYRCLAHVLQCRFAVSKVAREWLEILLDMFQRPEILCPYIGLIEGGSQVAVCVSAQLQREQRLVLFCVLCI